MSIELPPLPSLPSRSFADHERYIIQLRDVMKARERIFQARIAELEAEVADLSRRLTTESRRVLIQQREDARAEVERLRADAERYRWLREYNTVRHPEVTEAFFLGDANLDAAIDAARSAP